MKKKLKVIFVIVITAIISNILSLKAATLFTADQVAYTSNSQSTVKGALDDLYDKVSYGNATAANILTGKTALVAGSKITGTMANISTSKVATLTSSDTRPVLQQSRQTSGDSRVWALANSDGTNRLGFLIPQVGYSPSGTIVGVPYADVASAIGLTSTKLVPGQTVLGITSSVPSRASSGNVKSDKAWPYNNRMYFGVDYGYYPSSSYGSMTEVSERYITYASLARDIGLTAAKLMNGQTVLGITGTYKCPVRTYTITFNGNGGTPTSTSKTVQNGSTYGTLPTASRASASYCGAAWYDCPNTPGNTCRWLVQVSYTFKGWFTAASGGTQVTANTTVSLSGNQTLYAQWNESSWGQDAISSVCPN